MKTVKEDAGPVMAAGNGGFSNAAAASGPVAGYDPVMGFKKRLKKKIIQRAKPPYNIKGINGDAY